MANFNDNDEYDASVGSIHVLNLAVPWLLRTTAGGSYQPNAWGLYDMIGNALQWCGDWFADYPSGPVENPQGPTEGREKILRGGSFIYGPRHCRCAFRGRNSPEFRNFYVGFRVLLEIP